MAKNCNVVAYICGFVNPVTEVEPIGPEHSPLGYIVPVKEYERLQNFADFAERIHDDLCEMMEEYECEDDELPHCPKCPDHGECGPDDCQL